jgi:hypothetical protein
MSSDMGAHVAGTVLNSLGIRARNSTHLLDVLLQNSVVSGLENEE